MSPSRRNPLASSIHVSYGPSKENDDASTKERSSAAESNEKGRFGILLSCYIRCRITGQGIAAASIFPVLRANWPGTDPLRSASMGSGSLGVCFTNPEPRRIERLPVLRVSSPGKNLIGKCFSKESLRMIHARGGAHTQRCSSSKRKTEYSTTNHCQNRRNSAPSWVLSVLAVRFYGSS